MSTEPRLTYFLLSAKLLTIFNHLSKYPNRVGDHLHYNYSSECKRTYLDRTKLFIKINYQLLQIISKNEYLTSLQKVLWLGFYTKCYKYHMRLSRKDSKVMIYDNNRNVSTNKVCDDNYYNDNNCSSNINSSFSFTTSYRELSTEYDCTIPALSKAMIGLDKLGFIAKNNIYIKHEALEQDRQDKSLWQISLLLPNIYHKELIGLKDRSNIPANTDSYISYSHNNLFTNQSELENEKLIKDRNSSITEQITPIETTENSKIKDNTSFSDPLFTHFIPLLNKDFKSNIKDLDSIDSENIFFENLPQTDALSNLSVSYKNSFELEKKVNLSPVAPIALAQEDKLEILNELQNEAIEEEETLLVELNEHCDEKESAPKNNVQEDNAKQEYVISPVNVVDTAIEAAAVGSIANIQDKASSSKTTQSTQAKSLKSFYPLTKEQVDKINYSSGRQFGNGGFSVNFANQLLLKLSRDTNKLFLSKNHMMSYMSKAFRYEKHQAPMVNHETFRFTANVSDPESVEMRQKEKYLSEVEYSMDTSYYSQLRKKIAGIFETKLAYQILTEGEFDYHATSQELEIKNDICRNLELSEENNITQFDHVLDHSTCFVDSSLSLVSKHYVAHIDYDNQLSTNVTEENDQIKSGLVMTENDDINYDINVNIITRELSELSLKSSLPARQLTRITLANTCTVKLPRDLTLTNYKQQNLENAIVAVYGYVKIVYQQLPATYKKLGLSRLPDEIFLTELDQNSVWYKIRKKLITNFDEHIDKAWFSKLRAEEDAITQKLTLIAPTNFLKDWINNKYGSVIKDIAQEFCYQFVELVTKKQSLCNIE